MDVFDQREREGFLMDISSHKYFGAWLLSDLNVKSFIDDTALHRQPVKVF